MKYIIIVLILILIILLFINKNKIISKKEKFSQINFDYANKEDSPEEIKTISKESLLEEDETNLDPSQCEFIAYGSSQDACIERCNSKDKVLWGGNSCSYEKCTKICGDCNNKNNCNWLKPEVVVDKKDLKPQQFKINVIPGNGKVVILWKTNENIENLNTGFIVQYFKTYKPFEGLKLKSVKPNQNKTYKIVIENLINNEFYSFGVYAVNNYGSGEISNIEMVEPNEKKQLSI